MYYTLLFNHFIEFLYSSHNQILTYLSTTGKLFIVLSLYVYKSHSITGIASCRYIMNHCIENFIINQMEKLNIRLKLGAPKTDNGKNAKLHSQNKAQFGKRISYLTFSINLTI